MWKGKDNNLVSLLLVFSELLISGLAKFFSELIAR